MQCSHISELNYANEEIANIEGDPRFQDGECRAARGQLVGPDITVKQQCHHRTAVFKDKDNYTIHQSHFRAPTRDRVIYFLLIFSRPIILNPYYYSTSSAWSEPLLLGVWVVMGAIPYLRPVSDYVLYGVVIHKGPRRYLYLPNYRDHSKNSRNAAEYQSYDAPWSETLG